MGTHETNKPRVRQPCRGTRIPKMESKGMGLRGGGRGPGLWQGGANKQRIHNKRSLNLSECSRHLLPPEITRRSFTLGGHYFIPPPIFSAVSEEKRKVKSEK